MLIMSIKLYESSKSFENKHNLKSSFNEFFVLFILIIVFLFLFN